MKVHELKASPERRILIGLICNDAVCGRVASRWEEDGLFPSKTGNVIGQICVDHFNRYGRAPGKDVESLAASWAEGRDDDTAGEVDDFLRSLDGEYEKLAAGINADHVIDVAGDYFTKVKLQGITEAMNGYLLKGQVKKALALTEKIAPVEMGAGSYIDPLEDDEALRRVFQHRRESIIKYRGGLGDFFGNSLERDGLIAILAPEKRGKSWWLLDFAFEGVLQNLKVAVFECGDLTQDQVMARFLTRVAKRPLTAGTYLVPISLNVEDGKAMVGHEEMEVTKDLSEKSVRKYRDRFRDEYDARNLLRLSIHSTDSLSVPGMRSILARWAKEGWSPDVVVIDYADILTPPTGGLDSRNQINATWKLLSKMRQDLHCLVVTATQSDADSYDTDLIRRSNFSEDKRKYAHVTGMFALNQTPGEMERGIYRLNWLVRRSEPYSERRVCFVAGCLATAQPAVLSYFGG